MLDTLKYQVDPKHAAVIVVDVQNDFCAGGGAMHDLGHEVGAAQEMVHRLAAFIEEARRAGVRIIWVKVNNFEWTLSPTRKFLMAMARRGRAPTLSCVPGSWGQDYYQLKPAEGEIEILKHRYSAFIGTNLDLILRSLEIKTIIMTGVATNVCVESTARDGSMLDYHVVFLEDCTATYRHEWHEATLANIANFFGIVTSSTEVAKIWRESAG